MRFCWNQLSLREKCPNTEFFLVRIFPHFSHSVFSPNVGKYGPEKTPYLDNFHAVYCLCTSDQDLDLHHEILSYYWLLQVQTIWKILFSPLLSHFFPPVLAVERIWWQKLVRNANYMHMLVVFRDDFRLVDIYLVPCMVYRAYSSNVGIQICWEYSTVTSKGSTCIGASLFKTQE